MKKSLCFILYFNEDYLPWAKVLIPSIKLFHPDAYISLHLVNMDNNGVSDFQIREILKDKYTIDYYDIEPMEKAEISWRIIESKALFFLRTLDAIESDIYIMVDTDMILVQPLPNEITDGDFDIAGYMIKEKLKVAGGFIALRSNRLTENFLNEWNDYLLNGEFFYDKDQPSFYQYVIKYMNKYDLKWKNLDYRYLDPAEKNNSYFWSAHKSGLEGRGTTGKDMRIKKYEKKLEKMSK